MQHDTLEVIYAYLVQDIKSHGYPPSICEMLLHVYDYRQKISKHSRSAGRIISNGIKACIYPPASPPYQARFIALWRRGRTIWEWAVARATQATRSTTGITAIVPTKSTLSMALSSTAFVGQVAPMLIITPMSTKSPAMGKSGTSGLPTLTTSITVAV